MDSFQSKHEMEVTEERYFSTHHLLLRAANAAVMEAQGSSVRNRELHILTAMVMSALAVEALYNAIGYRIVPGWKDFEQISAWAKTRLICSVLKIDYDKGCEPWQRLKKLLLFRNAIAHGKPEEVIVKRKLSVSDYDRFVINRLDAPISKFERGLTVENARLSLACVSMVKDLLISSLPEDSKIGLLVDAWTYSEEKENESGVRVHLPDDVGNRSKKGPEKSE